MRRSDVDLGQRLVHIPDSKTPNGIGDMPMTEQAWRAFEAQLEQSLGSEYLFPTPNPSSKKPYMTSLKRVWASTLKRAGISHFPLYELRHTFATRLSAGGVADHFVTKCFGRVKPRSSSATARRSSI